MRPPFSVVCICLCGREWALPSKDTERGPIISLQWRLRNPPHERDGERGAGHPFHTGKKGSPHIGYPFAPGRGPSIRNMGKRGRERGAIPPAKRWIRAVGASIEKGREIPRPPGSHTSWASLRSREREPSIRKRGKAWRDRGRPCVQEVDQGRRERSIEKGREIQGPKGCHTCWVSLRSKEKEPSIRKRWRESGHLFEEVEQGLRPPFSVVCICPFERDGALHSRVRDPPYERDAERGAAPCRDQCTNAGN